MNPIEQISRRQLLVVTGKGGVGKTVVAATLGRALAAAGRRTLVVEVDPRENLHQMMGTPPSGGDIMAAEPRLWVQNLKPQQVLDQIVREQLKLELLTRRVLDEPDLPAVRGRRPRAQGAGDPRPHLPAAPRHGRPGHPGDRHRDPGRPGHRPRRRPARRAGAGGRGDHQRPVRPHVQGSGDADRRSRALRRRGGDAGRGDAGRGGAGAADGAPAAGAARSRAAGGQRPVSAGAARRIRERRRTSWSPSGAAAGCSTSGSCPD